MVTYREANEEDLPALCRLGEEVNAIHHEAWPGVFAAPDAPDRDRSHWAQSVGKTSATTFVAEANGLVVGFVSVSVLAEAHSLLQPLRYARIGSVAVNASHRGSGYGELGYEVRSHALGKPLAKSDA